MLCAISIGLSLSSCLSVWVPDTWVKSWLNGEWTNVFGWLPRGSWTFSFPFYPLLLSYFRHTSSSLQRVVSCVHPLCPSLITQGFFSYFHFYSPQLSFSLPLFLFSISVHHPSSYLSNFVSASLNLFGTHMLGHRLEPTMWAACAADLPLIMRQPRWTLRPAWRTDFDQHHNSNFFTVGFCAQAVTDVFTAQLSWGSAIFGVIIIIIIGPA